MLSTWQQPLMALTVLDTSKFLQSCHNAVAWAVCIRLVHALFGASQNPVGACDRLGFHCSFAGAWQSSCLCRSPKTLRHRQKRSFRKLLSSSRRSCVGHVCGQPAQLQLLRFQRAGIFGHRYHCNTLFLPGACSEATSKAETSWASALHIHSSHPQGEAAAIHVKQQNQTESLERVEQAVPLLTLLKRCASTFWFLLLLVAAGLELLLCRTKETSLSLSPGLIGPQACDKRRRMSPVHLQGPMSIWREHVGQAM